MEEEREEKSAEQIKGELIDLIDEVDLVSLSFIINRNYYAKKGWETYLTKKRQQEKYEKDYMDPISQLVAKKIDDSLPKFTKKEYEENQERYEEALNNIYFFENDEDVIQHIAQKFEDFELDFDPDDTESKAIATQALSTVLTCDICLQANDENNLWKPIQDKISSILEKMSTQDLMIIYQTVDDSAINNYSKFSEIFSRRIPEMSEAEFLLYSRNASHVNVIFNQDAKEKLDSRIMKTKGIFASYYLKLFGDETDIANALLNNAKKEERVNAIISSGVIAEGEEKTNNIVIDIAKKLSPEELLRYVLYSSGREYPALGKVIESKLNDISNEDLKFVVYEYMKRKGGCYRESQIDELLSKRLESNESIRGVHYNAVEDSNPGEIRIEFHGDEIVSYEARFMVYSEVENMFSPDKMVLPEFSMAPVEIYTPDETKEQCVMQYKENVHNMQSYSNFVDFIVMLSESKDNTIMKTILDANKVYDTTDVDRKTIEYWEFINSYLKSRIINIEDDKLLFKIAALGRLDGMLEDSVATRIYEIDTRRKQNKNIENQDEDGHDEQDR